MSAILNFLPETNSEITPLVGCDFTAAEIKGYLEHIEEHGYVILPNILDKKLVSEIRQVWKSLIAELSISPSNTRFEGGKTLRLYNLLAHHPIFQKIPLHPSVLSIMEQILGQQLLLSSMTLISPQPGERSQNLHADADGIPISRPHTPLFANSIWALEDIGPENGGTRIVPGSHKLSYLPVKEKEYETVSVELPAGSVLIFLDSLWHGAGANESKGSRDAIACYYSRGFMRAEENPFLGIPIETAKTFPRRLAELCGYSYYNGLYGHIAKRDPIEYLGKESVKTMAWDRSRIK